MKEQEPEETEDLEDALSSLREAVDITPDGHPRKPGLLQDLGKDMGTGYPPWVVGMGTYGYG